MVPDKEWAREAGEDDNAQGSKRRKILDHCRSGHGRTSCGRSTGHGEPEWDFGAKLGYESNVNRSLDDAQADTIFTAYAAYDRSLSGESRLDWTLRAALSGSAYMSDSDLNQVTGTIAPGISVSLSPVWSLNVSPFLRGKGSAIRSSRPSPTGHVRRCRKDGILGSTRDNIIFIRTAMPMKMSIPITRMPLASWPA